jgi:hypothetical protein
VDHEAHDGVLLEREHHRDAEAVGELRAELAQHVTREGLDADRRPGAPAVDAGRGAAVEARQVLGDDALDRLGVVALHVHRADAFSDLVSCSAQLGERDAHHRCGSVEAEPLVEANRVRVSLLDVELHVRQSSLARYHRHALEQRRADPSPPRLVANVEIDDEHVAFCEFTLGKTDGPGVLLRDQDDAFVDALRDAAPIFLRRVFGIRQRRQLEMQPLHGFCSCGRHAGLLKRGINSGATAHGGVGFLLTKT